jgi:hypothetical protein
MIAAEVRGYILAVPDWWHGFTPEQLAAYQNGIGIEAMPPQLRWTLNHVSGFLPAADVHDVEWGAAAKGYKHHKYGKPRYAALLLEADMRFRDNCQAIIDQDGDTPWRHPLRWTRRKALRRAFYRAVRAAAQVKIQAA